MKRNWNWLIWVGALVVIAGVVSYLAYFIRFAALRDFPWVNLPMIAIGLAMIGVGLARAFREPARYRGKIFGSIVGVLMVGFAALFCYGIFVSAREMPASKNAPQVGQIAPDFTLPDSQNRPVKLSGVLSEPFAPGGGQTAGVVLIFYRGYW
jgi:hypothetical protein